jgi:hypothetical protein
MCIYVCLSCDIYHLSYKHATKIAQTALCFILSMKKLILSIWSSEELQSVCLKDLFILLQDACAMFHQTDL